MTWTEKEGRKKTRNVQAAGLANGEKAKGAESSGEEDSAPFALLSRLSDQGSNLDFLESKSSVLPVTPSDNFPSKIRKPYSVWVCKCTTAFIQGKYLGKNFFEQLRLPGPKKAFLPRGVADFQAGKRRARAGNFSNSGNFGKAGIKP